jgi:predicted dehydrogenase
MDFHSFSAAARIELAGIIEQSGMKYFQTIEETERMSEDLGVLIIGTGWVADEHIRAYMSNPHTEIRGLCNIHPEKAVAARSRFGLDCPVSSDYQELLTSTSIDLVSVCTIHSAHFEQAKDALDAGKHVFVEKPLCLTFEQLCILKNLTLKKKLKTAVGWENRRL